ncbi:MAG: T9SS type A sorting domain-containing protein [Flavobacteriales bacterium]|nr:T9SS type A sorting domain-containing protein [Flavobacteriales bacterium]
MKKFFTLAILLVGLRVAAQTPDTAMINGTQSDIFYSLENGEVKAISNKNWDIAIEAKGFAGSILINGQNGVMLYSSPYAIEDWDNFDSTGFKNWPSHINSVETWDGGAFNQNLTSDYDLGWGVYDPGTHMVVGDSIYFIQLSDKSFRRIYIDELASSTYTFVIANVDGTNKITQTLKKTDYTGRNFAYYSIVNDAFLDREPDAVSWDFVFTKYVAPIDAGGQIINYPVYGVKLNKNTENAQRDGLDVTSNDTSFLDWNTNITEIGYDWKSWNGTSYDITPDQVFFVRTQAGAVWKLYFTSYSSSEIHFVKEKVGNIGIAKTNDFQFSMFPNPANDMVTIQLPINEELLSIAIIGSNGQTLVEQTENFINTNNLSNGLYFVTILTKNGSACTPLIIAR